MTDAIVADDYDAHETVKPAEPHFTVQGGDPLGPMTVQFWADKARAMARSILRGERAGHPQPTDEDPNPPEYTPTSQDMQDADALLRKATSAETVAWDFQAYQRGDIAPAEVKARYSDEPLAVGNLGEVDARKRLIHCANQLNNSVAIAHDAAEALAALRVHPEEEVAVREAVEALRSAANSIDPRKGNERT